MKLPKFNQSSTLRPALLYLALSAGLVGFAYVAVQQNYRQSANDPQIQMVEEAAGQLDHGVTPAEVVASVPKAPSNVSPALTIFDTQRQSLASSISRDPSIMPPAGSFDYAAKIAGEESRFTWQPAPGTRQAAVLAYVTPSSSHGAYYVLADRSLAETESRERQLTTLAALALGGLLAVGLVVLLVTK